MEKIQVISFLCTISIYIIACRHVLLRLLFPFSKYDWHPGNVCKKYCLYRFIQYGNFLPATVSRYASGIAEFSEKIRDKKIDGQLLAIACLSSIRPAPTKRLK